MTCLQGTLLSTARPLFLPSCKDPAPSEAPGARLTLGSEAIRPARPPSAPENSHACGVSGSCMWASPTHVRIKFGCFFLANLPHVHPLDGPAGETWGVEGVLLTPHPSLCSLIGRLAGAGVGLVTRLVWSHRMWEPCLLS